MDRLLRSLFGPRPARRAARSPAPLYPAHQLSLHLAPEVQAEFQEVGTLSRAAEECLAGLRALAVGDRLWVLRTEGRRGFADTYTPKGRGLPVHFELPGSKLHLVGAIDPHTLLWRGEDETWQLLLEGGSGVWSPAGPAFPNPEGVVWTWDTALPAVAATLRRTEPQSVLTFLHDGPVGYLVEPDCSITPYRFTPPFCRGAGNHRHYVLVDMRRGELAWWYLSARDAVDLEAVPTGYYPLTAREMPVAVLSEAEVMGRAVEIRQTNLATRDFLVSCHVGDRRLGLRYTELDRPTRPRREGPILPLGTLVEVVQEHGPIRLRKTATGWSGTASARKYVFHDFVDQTFQATLDPRTGVLDLRYSARVGVTRT